ncbi:MAG: hypothetical protein IT259_03330 [Saprospiraceae bacterium]|nr:hypothetical protein [Saprospiraceae bacterium]
MKKKIEKLRQQGKLAQNAAFEDLYTALQAAETTLEKAKTDRKIAKSAYYFEREAARKDGMKKDNAFEMEIAWMKAEGECLICRADYRMAKYRLRRWLEEWSAAPAAAETAAAKPAPKKRAARTGATAEKTARRPAKSKANNNDPA